MELPLHGTHVRLGLLFSLLLLAGTLSAPAEPIISEFLADNETNQRDEDGDFEDWLELFNPDPDPVDLSGYYLTDNPNNLDKWRIPDTTVLESNGFLLIFASGKDRAVAGQRLHTSFALDDSGEYLALVAPDGFNVVSEFAPVFPPQFDDASYGYEQIPVSSPDVLLDVDEACKALVPASSGDAPGTLWTELGYDDAAWTAGTLGLGYERGAGYESQISFDIEQDAFNTNSSVLVRIPFTMTDLQDIIALTLDIQYDDGFAAYLNGGLVASSNSPAIPTWNSNATNERTDAEALDFASFPLNGQINRLRLGDNILSIHLMNSSPGDDNLLLRPQLIATRLEGLTIGDLVYFADPTPGTRNGVQEGLPASEVLISVPSKTFVSPFHVSLSSAFAGETIRYTLDGEIPTTASTEYTIPIQIGRSTQLRARVFGDNNAAGRLAMESYLHLTGDLIDFSSNLPIMILDTWGTGDPGGSSLKDAFWAIIEPDPVTGRARMTDPFKLATRCGLKRRGSSSFNWPKYSMTVEAQNEDSLDKGVKPLGLPRESDWVLSGRYQFDHALMRNDLIYELSRQTGEYATRTAFVEVFHNPAGGSLNYAGDYFGVYSLMEKIKRDDSRVDVARLDRRDVTEPDITGGYIFKKDRADPGDSGFPNTTMGTLLWVEPKESDVEAQRGREQLNYLRDHLNELSAALSRPDFTNPTTGKHFTEYIDQFSWLRHHWCNTLAMNVDGFRLSGYYYKHRIDTNGGKVGAGPIWDFDRTMGSTDSRDDNPQRWDGTGDSSGTWVDQQGRFRWWEQALRNSDFRQAHTDLWQELRKSGNPFHIANIYAVIDSFAAQIDFQDPAGTNPPGISVSPAARNFEKWNRGRIHRNEVNTLKTWLRSRTGWIDRQYTPPPGFSTAGTFVAPGVANVGEEFAFIGGSGHRIYYTTDGSDPRLSGGAVSPAASLVASGDAIPINGTTIVTTRAYDPSPVDPLNPGNPDTQWSGPVKASFLIGPIADASNFVLSEVHYAPLPPQTPEEIAAAPDPSYFEFVEMKNISATDTINLTDVHFEAGIVFTFTGSAITSLAPGETVLVVCDQAAFEARYGSSHNDRIAGEFAPSRLDNAGERLLLLDGIGGTIADFTYNDKNPWPADAGITGYSMILRTSAMPNPDYAVPTNWRSSGGLGGNPNASDSQPLVGDPNEDLDGDGLQKILEHALGTSDDDPDDANDLFTVGVQSLEAANVTSDYLTITYQRDLTADDVDLFPEISYDGTTWLQGAAILQQERETNQGDGTSIVTFRTALPFDPDANPLGLVRLKALLP